MFAPWKMEITIASIEKKGTKLVLGTKKIKNAKFPTHNEECNKQWSRKVISPQHVHGWPQPYHLGCLLLQFHKPAWEAFILCYFYKRKITFIAQFPYNGGFLDILTTENQEVTTSDVEK